MFENPLRLFEGKALAEALTLFGHSTSERTVQRWKKGETTPKPQDFRAIRALVESEIPDTQRSAAPDIPERLEAVHRLVVAIAKATPGVDAEVVEETEVAHLDADELRRGRQQSASQRRKVDRRPRDK